MSSGPAGSGYDEPTGWTGWVVFAAAMLMLAGVMQSFYGVVDLSNDNWVVWGQGGALLLDITAWGWVHIIWGVLVVLVGVGLMRGIMVARILGVIVACFSLLVNFVFIPAYPFWVISVIVIDVLLIWAIIVHGREMKAMR